MGSISGVLFLSDSEKDEADRDWYDDLNGQNGSDPQENRKPDPGDLNGDRDDSGSLSEEGSVSGFLRDARLGRVLAIERLTEKYLIRLESFANSRMSVASRQVEDEQDIAIKVLSEFFSGMMNGKYDGLRNREQLWRLLAKITVCRVIDHYEKYQAKKRGAGQTKHLGNLAIENVRNDFNVLSDVSIDEIDPQLSLALKESYEQLFESICDDLDQSIVQLNLEGLTNHQIAKQLGIGERTVRNRLGRIQQSLIDELKS